MLSVQLEIFFKKSQNTAKFKFVLFYSRKKSKSFNVQFNSNDLIMFVIVSEIILHVHQVVFFKIFLNLIFRSLSDCLFLKFETLSNTEVVTFEYWESLKKSNV